MDNLDDLRAIWHTAKSDSLPRSGEMLQLIKTFRNQKIRNKWAVIIVSSLISILIIAVLVFVNFRLMTTYVGGVLMVISGFLIAATNFRSLKRFNQLDDCSNREFIDFIEQTRQNQIYYYKKTMVGVVLLNTIGWLLYLYEVVHQQTLWIVGAFYIVALVYLAVLWFVIRPRTFRKDSEKLDATRQRLENISNQLK